METEVATTFEASVVMKQQPDNVAILIESSELVRSTASEQQPDDNNTATTILVGNSNDSQGSSDDLSDTQMIIIAAAAMDMNNTDMIISDIINDMDDDESIDATAPLISSQLHTPTASQLFSSSVEEGEHTLNTVSGDTDKPNTPTDSQLFAEGECTRNISGDNTDKPNSASVLHHADAVHSADHSASLANEEEECNIAHGTVIPLPTVPALIVERNANGYSILQAGSKQSNCPEPAEHTKCKEEDSVAVANCEDDDAEYVDHRCYTDVRSRILNPVEQKIDVKITKTSPTVFTISFH